MNCSPTITAEEFKTIHNALCNLDSVTRQLEDVLKPELFEKLAKAGSTIREGLQGAYRQDNEAFETKNNHYDRIKEELGLRAIWSLYEVDNLSDRHPFEGATKVVYKDHWGDTPIEKTINGATWAALYVAADACIRESGDGHHVFIEQFSPSKNDAGALFLSTGS